MSNAYYSNPSVFDRTVQGNYPIAEGETITIDGYNLGDNGSYKPTVTINYMNNTTETPQTTTVTYSTTDKNTAVTVAADTKSGNLVYTVNGVTASNGINGNDAEYNSQPNGVNNDLLKDDVNIDVWKFKTAATPRDGKIGYPEMKIGPSGEVGFAFVNGGFYFNMAGPTTYGDVFTGNNNTSTWASQRAYESDYAIYYESALAFDVNGKTYGISTNEDSNSNFSAYTSFYFGQHATDTYGKTGYTGKASGNYQGGAWRRRLQSTTSTVVSGVQDTQVDRCQDPSIAITSGSKGNGTNVYVVYYDSVRKEVRYRWGTFGTQFEQKVTNVAKNGNTYTITTEKNHGFTNGTQVTFDWNASDTTCTQNSNKHYCGVASVAHSSTYEVSNANGKTFTVTASAQPVYANNYVSAIGGQIVDANGGWTGDDKTYMHASDRNTDVSTRAEFYSVIADKTSCGQYVSIGAIPGASSSADDTVVICWYDKIKKCLRYGYTTDPCKDDITLSKVGSSNIIDSNAGEYCELKVDSDGGVHIAYYDRMNQDLKYAYTPNVATTAFTCVTVESFLNCGQQISLDVAKDSDGNLVPYIGYYSQGSSSARVAYPVKWNTGVTSGSSTVQPATLSGVEMTGGVSSRATDKHTGNWEVSCVPFVDKTPMSDNDYKVCIGVHKNWTGTDKGVLSAIASSIGSIETGTGSTDNGDSVTASRTGGNGTTNPGVAFVIEEDYSLQFAQKN